MKDILKGSAIIFIFKMGGAISLFLVHIIISRYYGAKILGIFNLILTLLMISSTLSKIGLDIYVLKIIPSYEKNHTIIALFLKEVLKIVFISSVIVTILFYIFSNTINMYIFKSFDASSYLFGLTILIIPFTYFNIIPEIFRAFHNIRIYSFFKNLSQNLLLFLLLSLGIFSTIHINPIYALYTSIILITIILFIVLYRFLKKNNIDLSVKGKYEKRILVYSYPMFLTSSMMFIMGYLDSFMISYYLDEYQVGIYSACIKLSFAITFILASVNGFIAPKISQAYSKGNIQKVKEIYKHSVKLIVITTTPIFLLLYIFPNFFLGIFGDEFKVATLTLMIIAMAYLINALLGPVGYMLNMTNNQHIFMKILLIGLIVNIILNSILIPRYEINGAAIATLVSMSIWNMISFYILKQKQII